MTRLLEHLSQQWLASIVAGVAILVVILAILLRRRLGGWGIALQVLAWPVAAFALGRLLVSPDASGWFLVLSLLALGVLFTLLLLLGLWSGLAWLAATVLLFLALGGRYWQPTVNAAGDLGNTLATLEFVHPWWLLLLLLLPVFILIARRSLYLQGLTEAERIEFQDRILLWLAIFPPAGFVWLIVFLFRTRGRIRIETWRPWLSLGLRCLLVLFLTLALAEPRVEQNTETVTVLFVLDRSASVPQELAPDPGNPGRMIDKREVRIRDFINAAVLQRGKGRDRDMAGLITFGRRPRLELPPAAVPQFNLEELPTIPDSQATNIAAALKLAQTSFPPNTGKRIVLISDGNETIGLAEDAARDAKELGIQIDVLPLGVSLRHENEVLVESVDVPAVTEQGSKVPVTVQVRSFHPAIVRARLTLKQITEKEVEIPVKLPANKSLGLTLLASESGKGLDITGIAGDSPLRDSGIEKGNALLRVDGRPVNRPDRLQELLDTKKPGDVVELTVTREPTRLVVDQRVHLRKGLNKFSFTRPLTDEQRSYTYEAEIQPLWVEDANGDILIRDGLPGDRPQNNRASAHVLARGQRRVLILENRAPDDPKANFDPNKIANPELLEVLQEIGGRKQLKVDIRDVSFLQNFPDETKLAVFLGDYDAVIMVDIPAERVSEPQRQAIHDNVCQQGCGLIVIGGPRSYGAGGWQKTKIEEALPVDCDIKSMKVDSKSGLVLIMHASEIADANFWQKKIAKLAVERLGPMDEVGIIDFDFANKWHLPLQEVGQNKPGIMANIDRLMPGDMMDFDPAFKMAQKALMDPNKGIGTKHIILISDGDPMYNVNTLQGLADDKITVTTVGVACHGPNEDQKMADIARRTRGRSYSVKKPDELPAIYIKEARLVSQAFIYEKPFRPNVSFRSGPVAKIDGGLLDNIAQLRGFVRTTPKDKPTVEIPILTPKINEQEFPLVAWWPFGIGKSVAFTSDAGNPKFWSRDWYDQKLYSQFWEQVVLWALRPTESGRLLIRRRYVDGRIQITVEARDDGGKPDTTLTIRGGITMPGAMEGTTGPRQMLKFVQKNSGIYVAEIKAEEAGSYFITAQATRLVKVRGRDGVERDAEEGVDTVRTGVTIPHTREYSTPESNLPLLRSLVRLTNGKEYTEDDDELKMIAAQGVPFRPGLGHTGALQPLWYWLVFLTALALVIDIAARRIAVDPSEARKYLARVWARLRGLPIEEAERKEYFDRLKARKTQVGSTLDPGRTGRKFEATPGTVEEVPGVVTPTEPLHPEPQRPTPSTPTTPAATDQPQEDYAARLARAKRKAMEDRGAKDEEQ
jgi:uncharacterized membrane protein